MMWASYTVYIEDYNVFKDLDYVKDVIFYIL